MASYRPMAVFIAWLALLAGAAPACATLLAGDCCPQQVCCVVAPDRGQAMPSAATRTGQDERTELDPPDPLIPFCCPVAVAHILPPAADRFSLAPADALGGPGVYLRTGRLRL